MSLPAFIRPYEIPELTMSQALDVTHLVLTKLIDHYEQDPRHAGHTRTTLRQARTIVNQSQKELE